MIKTVCIKVDNGIYLTIKGEYHHAEEENGYPEAFEINEIESENKNIYDILEWATSRNRDYLRELEDLCLEKINEK